MKYISFILLMLSFNATFAQVTIGGSIKSAITDSLPISISYVEITNIDKPVLERMTMTDSLGLFKLDGLDPNKVYRIKVSTFGYTDQFFDVKANNKKLDTVLTIKGNCDYNREKAETDWKRGEAKLLLFGSIAPVANSKADSRFEKKFDVQYYDFGDSPPIQECMKIYNERIFELMDEKFGESWRKKVRKDVEFLK
jgi:hypothetical protein